ncbi:Ldh family oxidoreductase [Rhodobacter sp. SGA-6-6]|uniref:Ldh family oxidoreductase n=1 Tax=Rhodobacter sp. SGA-6-6 TaxID=2710882 RepID=UPI0013EB1FD8|nr:Ldh family oxidoreductase [Rhodobacter sp. SGA-6-6]NGM45558.1 Ldh family oxidoreductase [Rhodobacter sp. SGA-6-6]
MAEVTVSRDEAEALAEAALLAHGATAENARPTARAMVLAEAEGNPVCGLFYLPHFCAQLAAGKIDGKAVPAVATEGAVVRVDARTGFAHPAFEAGLPALLQAVAAQGLAAMSIGNSGNALAMGHFVRPLAGRGLVALAMSNAPASVAPPGAARRLFGTNPLAWAVPREGAPPIVVDQSLSAVTKTAVMMREASGQALEPGWAQDAAGKPTLDAAEALAGSLLPAGGQKGANMALLVEVLSAALAGAHLSPEASSLGDASGGPPRLGQFVLALDPSRFGEGFAGRIATLAGFFADAGLRLPGALHAPADRLTLPAELWDRVRRLAGRE